jgi:hypothetical protein
MQLQVEGRVVAIVGGKRIIPLPLALASCSDSLDRRCLWLRNRLDVLGQLGQIICIATGVLKTSGISYRRREAWTVKLTGYRTETTQCIMAEELVSVVENYFDCHDWLLARHGRLLCCFDIIESIFGRYKTVGLRTLKSLSPMD